MSTTIQMPKELDLIVQRIVTEGILRATTKLSETFKFDLDEATRVLDLVSIKVERGSPKKETKKDTKKETKKETQKETQKDSDDNMPKKKRPPTGYLVYSSATRAEIKAELTSALDEGEKLKPQDVVRALAARWKALEQDVRDEWNTKAKTPVTSDED